MHLNFESELTAEESIWTIELHNGVDNRLTETLLRKALDPALDAVEREWRTRWRAAKAVDYKEGVESAKGALIIVGRRAQNKFFSNGTSGSYCIEKLKYSNH